MNFGPLNKEGGERRLNVAITRARRRLIVFSSLRSDQIDLRRTRALGVKHFKTFLDYAERGPLAIAEATDSNRALEFDSGFERAVWKALTNRGLEVDTQVGCAGYRVDLAVRDPERPGRYLLGIECDGAAYHSAKTARDRDRLRQTVLEQLGWRIERVWSTEWRINPERCIASILNAVEEGRKDVSPVNDGRAVTDAAADLFLVSETEDGVAPGNDGESNPESANAPTISQTADPSASFSVSPVYRRATPKRIHGLEDLDIFETSSTSAAIDALVEIVSVEGPIVEELALRRLAEWFAVQRITDRFRDRFAEIRARALRSGEIREDGGVFWPKDVNPDDFDLVRAPGPDREDRRDPEHIPLVERVNAVVQILNDQFGLPREDLEREAARLLGLQRLTPRVKEAIGDAIDVAIGQGRAESDGGRVSLPAG